MCPALFANENVKWKGDVQIRAARLCTLSPQARRPSPLSTLKGLKVILNQARVLTRERRRYGTSLTIELFFADSIFDPHLGLVHGDFDPASARSDFLWPSRRVVSWKGPYGATGVYGKLEDGGVSEEWVVLGEEEWGIGVERGWVSLGL